MIEEYLICCRDEMHPRGGRNRAQVESKLHPGAHQLLSCFKRTSGTARAGRGLTSASFGISQEDMVINREHERIIPLREVPKHLPSRIPGKKLSFATVWRWALRSKDPLETFCTPGGRFTSIEALDRFVERCSNRERSASDNRPIDAAAAARAELAGDQLRRLMGGRHLVE